MTTLAPELLDGLVERAARPDFDAFEAQLRSSGHCARPIRMRGKIEICDRDAVFATLTAPSFGAAHGRPLGAGGKPAQRREGAC